MEDYKKKYEDALERARELYNAAKVYDFTDDMKMLEYIFPKLCEKPQTSDDEVQYKRGYDDGYLEGIVNAKKEFEKSKPTVIDIDKMVSKYANTKESSTSNLPLNCQIRAYRQGINNALNLLLDIEKPITIGKRQLTGKAADLAKEVTPESLEEAKEKLNAEEKLNKRLNKKIEDWFESGPPSSLPCCTVKDVIEMTARHFFELGLKAREDKQ